MIHIFTRTASYKMSPLVDEPESGAWEFLIG
jgi:hypothetical protein